MANRNETKIETLTLRLHDYKKAKYGAQKKLPNQ